VLCRPPAKELKFRSYVPHDDELRAAKVEEAHAPEPVAEPPPPPPEPADAEELLVGAVPKKANWDLRRDVAKKMEKLDRRTQWAIVELAHAEEKARMQLA
jgi:coiled-coil domain-containing protein 12